MCDQNKLLLALQAIKTHQADDDKAGISRKSRCLEYVRAALSQPNILLRLPRPVLPGGQVDTAMDCFRALAADPSVWGWKQVHSPLPSPCLVFFFGCGNLPDGRQAGHIAIYDGTDIRSNEDYPLSAWWAKRLAGAFVPA